MDNTFEWCNEGISSQIDNRPHGEGAAAFILDMNDFKKVNETRRRMFGNVVLMNVANSLKRACLPGYKMGYIFLCEGIETREQLDMLTEMGRQIGQGFYFSRPIPMKEFFEKFCQKNN